MPRTAARSTSRAADVTLADDDQVWPGRDSCRAIDSMRRKCSGDRRSPPRLRCSAAGTRVLRDRTAATVASRPRPAGRSRCARSPFRGAAAGRSRPGRRAAHPAPAAHSTAGWRRPAARRRCRRPGCLRSSSQCSAMRDDSLAQRRQQTVGDVEFRRHVPAERLVQRAILVAHGNPLCFGRAGSYNRRTRWTPQTLEVRAHGHPDRHACGRRTPEFVDVRGLRYHLRCWGGAGPARRTLVMLHGWMDVSASFQFVVDALGAGLARDRARLARLRPDRSRARPIATGFPTTWPISSACWTASAPGPAVLVGHSMGGNVALLYAGIRPGRVRARRQPRRLRPARDTCCAGPGPLRAMARRIAKRRLRCATTQSPEDVAARLRAEQSATDGRARCLSRAALGAGAGRRPLGRGRRSGSLGSSIRRCIASMRCLPAGSASPVRCSGYAPRTPTCCAIVAESSGGGDR